MRSTSEIRALWEPHCTNHLEAMRTAYKALDDAFKAFSYPVRQGDSGAANCRPITGGTGYSLHAYFDGARYTFWTGASVTMAVAVDVNWKTNPYGPNLVTDRPPELVKAIRAIKTVDGLQVWGWGGDYRGNKDAMHNEILLSAKELARGIVGYASPTPSKPTPAQENAMNRIANACDRFCVMANDDLVVSARDGSIYHIDADGVIDDIDYISAYNVHPELDDVPGPGGRQCLGVYAIGTDGKARPDGHPEAVGYCQVFDDGARYRWLKK